ncbi:uncharacterized protein LOC129984153 [Argiope bruennichi]|uniref:uncharacterized protein LOC129984153 n=1 Tax=Argiope bruennichi TaxID=94029 RepID=UPI002494C135|nr:uncharacterized protein LOC129984153 [Argiope bruennichi]
MKFSLLYLFLTTGASLAFITDRCDISKCSYTSPVEELQAVRYMPTERQLQRLCPKALSYLTCIFNIIENCVGHTVDILALSSNKSIASTTKALVEIDYLTVDTCDKKSWFRRAYLANIDCFRKFFSRNTRSCQKEAKYQLGEFVNSFNLTNGIINATVRAELQCLEGAFEYVCLTDKLRCVCCEYARWTYVTVLERLSPILREMHCLHVEGISILKEEFLDFLYDNEEYEEESRQILDIFID